jgi:hypothetical protein
MMVVGRNKEGSAGLCMAGKYGRVWLWFRSQWWLTFGEMAASPRLGGINIADRHLLFAQQGSKEGWPTFLTSVRRTFFEGSPHYAKSLSELRNRFKTPPRTREYQFTKIARAFLNPAFNSVKSKSFTLCNRFPKGAHTTSRRGGEGGR